MRGPLTTRGVCVALVVGLWGAVGCRPAPESKVPEDEGVPLDWPGGTPGGAGPGTGGPSTGGPVVPSGPPAQSVLLPDPARPFAMPPPQTTVETYELVVPQATLDEFAKAPKEAVERPAEFIYNGQRYTVEARLRGNSSRWWTKKSWRVEFPDGVSFQGRKKLNLLSEWMDCSLMVEKLGYDMLAAMGVQASRAKFVRLVINGRYQGLYLDLEHVDKRFARGHGFIDQDPLIYRCGTKNCEFKTTLEPFQRKWEKRTYEADKSNAELDALMEALNHAPEPELVEALERHFELELYLRTMVGDALISNNVVEDSASFILYDRFTRKWAYAPWDLNNSPVRYKPTTKLAVPPVVDRPLFIFSLTDPWGLPAHNERVMLYPERPWVPIFSNLNTRVELNPVLRERYLKLLERALGELFNEQKLGPYIDAYYALLSQHIGGEDNVFPHNPESEYKRTDVVFVPQFHDSPRYLKDYVRQRHAFLRQELQRLRNPPQGLVIEAFSPAEGWVELKNRGAIALDTTGLVLTTKLRDPMKRNMPGGTLAPGASRRFTAAELGLTFAPKGEVGLFDGSSIVGALDALFYGPLPAGKHYARRADAPQTWEIR